MREKHYKSMMSAFVNRELGADAQSAIAEHILVCGDCRAEHDRVRVGSMLAAGITQTDAPQRVWNNIEATLDEGSGPQMTLIADARFFRFRNLIGYAGAFVVVAGLVTVAYLALFSPGAYKARQDHASVADQGGQSAMPIDAASPLPVNADANTPAQTPELAAVPSWQFETISGAPKVGEASSNGRLAVGDYLETDAASRARIEVANIGHVDIQPNSLVKFVGTTAAEHRLSLERGVLQAKINAPPRLFIVDTPSAAAVDLGCEYTLEVDKQGNSRLHVKTGFVALERDGRESIVPAGAVCVTMRGRGLGTPYSADTSEIFRKALERFDFSNGGSRAVDEIVANSDFYDMITLWHLLSRVKKGDREKVYNALAASVKPPPSVTLEGVMRLDKKMLADWRSEVEKVWFD